jgi:hypothetical protein
MKRLLIALSAFAFFAVSCENTPTKTKETTKQKIVISDEITSVAMVDFDSLVENLTGRKISISGTVDHVCKHGGQKMFIVDQNTDARVKVTPNEKIAAFNTDLVGETIKVIGIVEEMRIDEDYLKEWEEEVKQGIQEEKGKGKHNGNGNGEGNHESADADDHDHEDIDIEEELDQIARMRIRVEESEKGYLSFYSILALEYQVFKLD